ncbi:MAG: hypothetical protein V1798_08570 [Pseudomonadota bacterium]
METGKAQSDLNPELKRNVEASAEWFQLLDKTLKSFRMYAPGHPTVLQFLGRLTEKTQMLLNGMGELTLAVKPYELMFSGHSIFRADEKQDNLCFKLHQAGLRQLTFREGLSPKELRKFLEILRTDFESYEHYDDDIVTLLWKTGFEHLSYVVVEAVVEAGGGSDLDAAVRRDVGELLGGDLPLSIHDTLREATSKSRKLKRADIAEIAALPELALTEESPLTVEISAGIRKQIDSDEETLIQKTLVVLFRALVQQQSSQADFDSVASVLKKLTVSLIRVGRFGLVAKILGKLRDLSSAPASDGGAARFMPPFYESFGSADIAGEIQKPVLGPGFDAFDGLRDLAGALPRSAFGILFEIFRVAPRHQVRKALIPALAPWIGAHVQVIQAAFSAAGKELALGLVEVLVAAGPGAERTQLLRRAVRHPEPLVRLKALDLIASEPVDATRNVFHAALRDPESMVRVKALQHVVKVKDLDSVRAIFDLVGDSAFDSRDLNEKKGFFMALAALGGPNLLEYFRQELDRGVLSRSEKDTDRRISAVHALAVLATPAALRIVTEVRDQKLLPSRVREVCDGVLAAWSKGKEM